MVLPKEFSMTSISSAHTLAFNSSPMESQVKPPVAERSLVPLGPAPRRDGLPTGNICLGGASSSLIGALRPPHDLNRGLGTSAEVESLSMSLTPSPGELATRIKLQDRQLLENRGPRLEGLRAEHQRQGENFSFPMLAPYLERMEQLLAGVLVGKNPFPIFMSGKNPANREDPLLAPLDDDERSQVLKLRENILELVELDYPYRDTWMAIVDVLVFLSNKSHPGEFEAKRQPDGLTVAHYRVDKLVKNPNIVLWPVDGYFACDWMLGLSFTPLYPLGLALNSFCDYDGFTGRSALDFFLHDISHAQTMAVKRDQSFGHIRLPYQRDYKEPSCEDVNLESNRRLAWVQELEKAVGVMRSRDLRQAKVVEAALALLMHENNFMVEPEPAKIVLMLEKQCCSGALSTDFDSVLVQFCGEKDGPLRFRAIKGFIEVLSNTSKSNL